MSAQTATSVVLLNYDYTYLNIVSIRKALSYFRKGKAIIEKASEKVIHTVSESFPIPLVMKMTYFVKHVHTRKISWSKRNVLIRDNHKCVYCGVEAERKGMGVDHIIPKAQGGKNTWENTVASCTTCNNTKGNRTPRQARMSFINKRYRPIQPTIMEFLMKRYKLLGVHKIVENLCT